MEGLLSNKSGNATHNKFAPANLYLSEHRIPLGDRFRLYGGQDDMIAVHDDNCPGSAAMGCIDQSSVFLGFILEPFHGRRIGSHDTHNPFRHHRVAESDVQ